MTVYSRRIVSCLLSILLLLPLLPVLSRAAPEEPAFRCIAGGQIILPQRIGEDWYLFLPAWADRNTLIFQAEEKPALPEGGELPEGGKTQADESMSEDGDYSSLPQEPVFRDLTVTHPPERAEDGVYTLTLGQEEEELTVRLMQSENIPALFLTSADPSEDRAWVDESKNNKAKGSAVMLDADGAVLYDGDLKQIKGRGNSTWGYEKKPYQLKLDQSADLTGCGEPSKTWVLLANYIAPSLLRNRITFDLAAELGLKFSPHSRPVDLYYDGEYRGSYLLSEKTEVGKNRVEIRDLDAAYEEANPELEDFDGLTLTESVSEAGYPFRYAAGLTDPEDLSGGYLLEVDYEDRAREEASWFSTPLGLFLTVKSPEYASEAAVNYISALWQRFEASVLAGGEDCGSFMDLTSLARCYLILELSQDNDAYLSSTYFYKPEGDSTLYAGPVWDFDSGYGLSDRNPSPTRLTAATTVLGWRLMKVPAIRQAVKAEAVTLHRLVTEILLSSDPNALGDSGLRSLVSYDREIAASRRMDRVLWPEQTEGPRQELAEFIALREPWLYATVADWPDTGTDSVTGSRFFDVTDEDWFMEPVTAVSDRGLLQGIGNDLFDPLGQMTRSMVCMVLYRLAGEPETAFTPVFSDVSTENWFASAVSWAYGQQVSEGYPDGSFRPDAFVTRQELVSMLYRYLSGEVPEDGWDLSAFADQGDVPDWALPAFGWAVDKGLVNGIPDNDGLTWLQPRDPLLRSQAAALFQRLLGMTEGAAPAAEAPAEDPAEAAADTILPDTE